MEIFHILAFENSHQEYWFKTLKQFKNVGSAQNFQFSQYFGFNEFADELNDWLTFVIFRRKIVVEANLGV